MDPLKTGAVPAPGVLDRLQKPETLGRPEKEQSAGQRAVPFSELLENRLQQPTPAAKAPTPQQALKFSAHAQARMQSRGIDLNAEDMLKLQEAVGKVRDKGARESLILTDKAAFIVSVKNGTVITAMDREGMKENIFTNIDSTIMI